MHTIETIDDSSALACGQARQPAAKAAPQAEAGRAGGKEAGMRTTLDIDDDILEAAKELARAERKTTGQVISELARKGLTQAAGPPGFAEEATPPFIMKDGWLALTGREGVVVTKELVDRLAEEADFEDAGLPPPSRKSR
jgi:hypothetical protein